jgi:hypothetical protein
MSLRINPVGQTPGLYWESLFQGQSVVVAITTGWYLSFVTVGAAGTSIGQLSFLYRDQQIVVVRPLNASSFDASQWLRIPFDQVQSAGYRLSKLTNQAVIGTGTRTVNLVAPGDLIGTIKRQEGWLTVIREHPLTRTWSLHPAVESNTALPDNKAR